VPPNPADEKKHQIVDTTPDDLHTKTQQHIMNQIVDALPLLCRAVTETVARVHEMPTAQETWRELTARIVIVHLYIPSSSESKRRKMMAVVHAHSATFTGLECRYPAKLQKELALTILRSSQCLLWTITIDFVKRIYLKALTPKLASDESSTCFNDQPAAVQHPQ
jgi:hypothetical protein